ncbi:MAG: CHAT domain-containing tetratricopeptide repeat protein [Planctomycetota bacterium]|jgi:CHAT domain-containing protein
MRNLGAALLALLFVAPLPAQDKPKPDTPEQAAGKVIVAFKAEDQKALKALAEKNKPEPWLVADELCFRGEHDAAEAFAKAAPRKDVETLPVYVASQRGKPDNLTARRSLAAAYKALGAKDPKAALAALEGADTSDGDVVSVRVLYCRGTALGSLRRLEESAEAFATAGEGAERIGWLGLASTAFDENGHSAYRRSDWRGALAAWERALTLDESRGYRAGVAKTLANIGLIHRRLREYPKALDCLERALKLYDELGDRAKTARILRNIGLIHQGGDAYVKALPYHERALKLLEDLNDRAGIARVLGNIGLIHKHLGDYATALEYQRQSLRLKEERKDRAGVALTLGNIGNTHMRLGDYAKALECQERALRFYEGSDSRASMARALGSIGLIHKLRGAYAKALNYQERALKLDEEFKNRAGVAITLGNIGNIHKRLGAYAKALDYLERALKRFGELENRGGMASCLGNIGNIHENLGAYDKALDYHERSLKLKERLDDRAGMAGTLGNIGAIHGRRGAYRKALDYQGRSLKIHEELADPAGLAIIFGSIGTTHLRRGAHAKALEYMERALEAAQDVGAVETGVESLWRLAEIHLALKSPAEAARDARRGVERLPALVGRLAEQQGATARDRWAGLLETGVRAGLQLGDPGEVSFFLESGRAGSLLESLGGRMALGSLAVPEGLAKEERAARAGVLAARALQDRALRAGKRKEIRAARTALQAAHKKLLEVVAKIQREAKAAANVVYPEADPLERIRVRLSGNEAMILYALMSEEAVALVVRRAGARTVSLGKTATIEKVCAALAGGGDGANTQGVSVPKATSRAELLDPDSDPAAQARKLRALVVAPLRLDRSVRRLLISPQGALASVPFAVLAGELEVAYVASGTTYGVLLDERRKHGRDVLALGDPDYSVEADPHALSVHTRGGPLARLPESRGEAKAVGDTLLLDKGASRTGLGKALASGKRWRSVHLACHGLVRADQPLLSSLALTPDAESGGFVTVLDVFGMKIPADLVVLSACETGRGKVYQAEGIVGFTRAFIFAGAPRVIVSLWKVDDAATRALMVKFYELWKPGKMPTATALKQAQEYVASQEKWKHPYYWAAWQLWGLAD